MVTYKIYIRPTVLNRLINHLEKVAKYDVSHPELALEARQLLTDIHEYENYKEFFAKKDDEYGNR